MKNDNNEFQIKSIGVEEYKFLHTSRKKVFYEMNSNDLYLIVA